MPVLGAEMRGKGNCLKEKHMLIFSVVLKGVWTTCVNFGCDINYYKLKFYLKYQELVPLHTCPSVNINSKRVS